MTLHQFLLILRARYMAVLATLLVTVTIATTASLLIPKQYTASTAVVIDVKSPDQVSGQQLQGGMIPGYMATQVDIINSDRVSQAAVNLLKLAENPVYQLQWKEATKGSGQLIDWLANSLQKGLDVKPSRESNVININFSGRDPEFAAAAANAFAKAYININLDLRLAPAREYAAFFEEQTKAARDKLEKAQQALSAYQQKNGITAVDERGDFETTKLNDTASQLTGIQGQTSDSESKRQATQADTIAEVMQSPLINGLKTDIARLESKLTESNVNLGKNHPQTLRSEAELAALKAQLASETRKITRSIETTFQVSKQRERQLQAALAAQKSRVLEMNRHRDELNVLRRDIESAQRTHDAVSQRASQTSLESQVTQTNIAVLNPAVAPTVASKPKVMLNILASVFLGMLMGVGLALVLELTNRKVRSAQDLVEGLDLPVLGSVGSATGLFKQVTNGVRA